MFILLVEFVFYGSTLIRSFFSLLFRTSGQLSDLLTSLFFKGIDLIFSKLSQARWYFYLWLYIRSTFCLKSLQYIENFFGINLFFFRGIICFGLLLESKLQFFGKGRGWFKVILQWNQCVSKKNIVVICWLNDI